MVKKNLTILKKNFNVPKMNMTGFRRNGVSHREMSVEQYSFPPPGAAAFHSDGFWAETS